MLSSFKLIAIDFKAIAEKVSGNTNDLSFVRSQIGYYLLYVSQLTILVEIAITLPCMSGRMPACVLEIRLDVFLLFSSRLKVHGLSCF